MSFIDTSLWPAESRAAVIGGESEAMKLERTRESFHCMVQAPPVSTNACYLICVLYRSLVTSVKGPLLALSRPRGLSLGPKQRTP